MIRCEPIPFIFLACLFAYRAPALSGSGITDPITTGTLATADVDPEQQRASDRWSWTFQGHSYRLTQWLGEVSMGLAHQLGNETGTAVLAALLVSLTMAASYRAARCSTESSCRAGHRRWLQRHSCFACLPARINSRIWDWPRFRGSSRPFKTAIVGRCTGFLLCSPSGLACMGVTRSG